MKAFNVHSSTLAKAPTAWNRINNSIYVIAAKLFEPISICERAKLGSELSWLEKSIHEGQCGKRRRPSQSVRRVFA
jgi:hypothetical protein